MPPNVKGALLALCGFAAFSSHDAVVKVLGGAYTPFQIIFFATLLSFPLATLMLMHDRMSGTLRPVHPWWLALRVISGVITGVCGFYAFSVLPMAQVYVFLFASPLLITILAIPILGEKVGPHRWAAVALGLAGVLVVLRPGVEPFSLGHFAGMTAAVFSALASVITRRIGREERALVMLLYPMTASFVLMGAMMPFVYEPMPVEHLGLLAVMSALGFGAGLLIIQAYKSGDAAVVAPMQYSQIIWAALFGLLIFNETSDRTTWVGVSIIIAAGMYVVLRESLGGRSRYAPVLRSRARPETGAVPRISASIRDRADRVEPGYVALAKRREDR